MYYGARYYLPELKRFISADTVVPSAYDSQALNRYSYVVNNPMKLVDPSGHLPYLQQPMIENAFSPSYVEAHSGSNYASQITGPAPDVTPSASQESTNPGTENNSSPAGTELHQNLESTQSGSNMWVNNTQNAWNIVTHPHEVISMEGGFGYYYLAGAWLAWEGFGATALAAGVGMFAYAGITAIASAITPAATAACADGDCTNEFEAVTHRQPENLSEQLSLEEAIADGGRRIMEDVVLGDVDRLNAVYGQGDWQKYQYVHYCLDKSNITIHWFLNKATGLAVEYKFK